MRIRWMTVAVLACFSIALPVHAQSGSESMPAGLADFVSTFRAAAQSGDASRLAPLAHPASRACATADPEGWQTVASQHLRVFGHDLEIDSLRWTAIEPAAAAALQERMAASGRATLPTPPDGRVQIDWVTPPNNARAANLLVARDDEGDWRWLHVCR